MVEDITIRELRPAQKQPQHQPARADEDEGESEQQREEGQEFEEVVRTLQVSLCLSLCLSLSLSLSLTLTLTLCLSAGVSRHDSGRWSLCSAADEAILSQAAGWEQRCINSWRSRASCTGTGCASPC